MPAYIKWWDVGEDETKIRSYTITFKVSLFRSKGFRSLSHTRPRGSAHWSEVALAETAARSAKGEGAPSLTHTFAHIHTREARILPHSLPRFTRSLNLNL